MGSRIRDRSAEPQPKSGRPTKPKWLSKEATKVWKQVLDQLEAMGVLRVSDGCAIARYCELLVRWVTAQKFVAQYGESYPIKNDAGKVKCFVPFPQSSLLNKLASLLLRIEQEFGLTPASRARVKVDARPNVTVITRPRCDLN